jgi:hypothetical protein
MRQPLIVLWIAALAAANPSPVFASGSSAKPPINQSINRTGFENAHPAATTSVPLVVDEEPYNRGKAVFAGNYRLGKPTLTPANVAEKTQRLVALQKMLPASAGGKLNSTEMSQRLTDREMNALEYYVRMRFGKFIRKAPSWAKEEPPPKVVSTQ